MVENTIKNIKIHEYSWVDFLSSNEETDFLIGLDPNETIFSYQSQFVELMCMKHIPHTLLIKTNGLEVILSLYNRPSAKKVLISIMKEISSCFIHNYSDERFDLIFFSRIMLIFVQQFKYKVLSKLGNIEKLFEIMLSLSNHPCIFNILYAYSDILNVEINVIFIDISFVKMVHNMIIKSPMYHNLFSILNNIFSSSRCDCCYTAYYHNRVFFSQLFETALITSSNFQTKAFNLVYLLLDYVIDYEMKDNPIYNSVKSVVGGAMSRLCDFIYTSKSFLEPHSIVTDIIYCYIKGTNDYCNNLVQTVVHLYEMFQRQPYHSKLLTRLCPLLYLLSKRVELLELFCSHTNVIQKTLDVLTNSKSFVDRGNYYGIAEHISSALYKTNSINDQVIPLKTAYNLIRNDISTPYGGPMNYDGLSECFLEEEDLIFEVQEEYFDEEDEDSVDTIDEEEEYIEVISITMYE